jgi:hypothetical protein
LPLVALGLVAILVPAALAPAAEPASGQVDELEAAKRKLAAQETYDLKYKWTPGETLRYRVEQLVTIETTIRGATQVAKSRSTCSKIWKVGTPGAEGQVTFTHLVDDADMWQQVTGRQEVSYNSRRDEVAPPSYAHVAKSIGVPLATITVNERGLVVSRENTKEVPQIMASNGQILMPLPTQPVRIGATWNLPSDVPVRLTDGSIRSVKIRLQYKLERVAHGLATISVATQVLTPTDDGAIKSQLVQRMSSGEVKFDIDAGRVVSQELNQDETVLAFSGADSNMQYLAKFTEKLVEAPEATATRAGPAAPK